MEYRCGSRSLPMKMRHPTRHQAEQISDTVYFCHQIITTPVVTPEDQILHGITTLTDALTDAPSAQLDAQLQSITALCEAFASWSYPDETPAQPMLHVPA